MRRIDKKLNMMKANLLAESRYLESKGLIKESIAINEFDVNLVPVKGDEELERFKNSINELLYGMNPMGYINRELVLQSKISPKQLNRKINDVVEILSDYAAQLKGRAKRVTEDTSAIGRDDLEDNIYSLLFDEQRGYINREIVAPSLRRSRIEDVIKIFTFYADRVKDGMQNYNNDSEEYNKQWGGHEKDDTNLDENSLYEIGPETASKALSYNNDPRQEKILQDATNSLFGEYIGKDLNFLFQGSRHGQPAKYVLKQVTPRHNFSKSTVDFVFYNENGIDDDAPFADNRKYLAFTYDIANDAIINKGNHESKYTRVTQLMNATTGNFFATAAKWIRSIYFKANPPKIDVNGEMVVDPDFNMDSKVKKQNFQMFATK